MGLEQLTTTNYVASSQTLLKTRPTIFIDRDGVINHNRNDHVLSWEEFQFLDGTLEALALLHQAGYDVIIVTNQAIVERGLISLEALEDIHRQMQQVVEAHGGKIEAVLYCPHLPEANCLCRKPRPGMLEQAARQFEIQLEESWLIGDYVSDIEAGQAIGCKVILVLTGRGQKALKLLQEQPNPRLGELPVKANLLEAVKYILQMNGTNNGNNF